MEPLGYCTTAGPIGVLVLFFSKFRIFSELLKLYGQNGFSPLLAADLGFH